MNKYVINSLLTAITSPSLLAYLAISFADLDPEMFPFFLVTTLLLETITCIDDPAFEWATLSYFTSVSLWQYVQNVIVWLNSIQSIFIRMVLLTISIRQLSKWTFWILTCTNDASATMFRCGIGGFNALAASDQRNSVYAFHQTEQILSQLSWSMVSYEQGLWIFFLAHSELTLAYGLHHRLVVSLLVNGLFCGELQFCQFHSILYSINIPFPVHILARYFLRPFPPSLVLIAPSPSQCSFLCLRMFSSMHR